MNRKIREVLQSIENKRVKINNLKNDARNLAEDGKLTEAKNIVSDIKKINNEIDELTIQANNFKYELEKEKESVSAHYKKEGGKDMKKIIKNAIYPNEKMSSLLNSVDKENKDIDFGKLVKGMVGKGWSNAKAEQEYFNMNTSGNEVLIPHTLSSHIIDMARTQSALFGNIPMVPMDSNNLTIAIQTKDAEANFVGEGELIPSSEAIFDSVDLKGKTLVTYIPVTEQLLDSANIEQQLMQSVAKAIVNKLDWSLLYGQGKDSIIGLDNIEGINKISHTTDTANYDFVVKGTKAVKKANIIPTNIAYNSDLSSELEMAKTKDGQYLDKPSFMDNYIISESNNIKENQAVVYDMNSLLLGINKNITIEWGYSNDDFQRLKKGLRVHLRADFTPIRKSGVALVNINEDVQELKNEDILDDKNIENEESLI